MGSFGIGTGELLLILLLALLVVGPGRMQETARGLGKALRQVNKYSSGLTSAFQDELEKDIAGEPDAGSGSSVTPQDTESRQTSGSTGTEGTGAPAPGENQ
ncbi:MAG: twin-arginine translocase TatA/TatE family subunit [Dehalococcoidia bacterium]